MKMKTGVIEVADMAIAEEGCNHGKTEPYTI